MCSPISPARARRRANGRRASLPPIGASRPTASSPRSTTAAKWSPRCCARATPILPVRTVTATRGKFLRAEPVAAAYERGLVFHVGAFPKLEDQLCALTPDFDARAAGFSPDRADALVWAVADLLGCDGRAQG